MKLSQILGKQHLERMARRHWFQQGKKRVVQTKAAECAAANGIQVFDAVETLLNPPKPTVNFDLTAVSENPLPKNERHPNYKRTPCYIHGDTSALVGGLHQAQVLSNTIVETAVPEIISKMEEQTQVPPEAHEQLQNKILLSCVFDAEQKKLPKLADPLRPAWNFPREYGITNARKNLLLCNHIFGLCDFHLKLRDIAFIENAKFELPLNAFDKQIKFEHNAEILATCWKPLEAFSHEKSVTPLPDLHPMDCTISLEPYHFYNVNHINPLSNVPSKFSYAHTAFLHYDSTQVSNIYDSSVTEDQVKGRLLIKAFCFAASEALRNQQKLPITVQAIHTNGHLFSFAIYQLNTLNVETEDARNVCWISRSEPLYETCSFVNGRPCLEGYNPAVLLKTMAFLSHR